MSKQESLMDVKDSEYDSIGRERSKTAIELTYAGVIGYNKNDLER